MKISTSLLIIAAGLLDRIWMFLLLLIDIPFAYWTERRK